MPPWAWAALGLALLLLESLNGTFILAVLGGASLLVAGIALLVPGPLVTVPCFALGGMLGLLFLRPLLLRRLRGAPDEGRSNVAALAGQSARLVAPFDTRGYARVEVGGEQWRAHLAEGWPNGGWAIGATFTVLGVQGVTLEVCPEQPPVAAVRQAGSGAAR